jgi:lipopolysaccharide biosynthesis glycosyltransferase
MLDPQTNVSDTTRERITVAFASDDVTAMPMAAAIASLYQSRAQTTQLDIHVLGCEVSAKSKARIDEIAARMSHDEDALTWHDITGKNAELLTQFYIKSDRPYPPANYARLLAGQLIPRDRTRAIYMDIDTIALTDLRPFWETEFDGATALVIRDLPHNIGQIERLLDTVTPQDRFRYELSEDTHYFQAGVMMLDLAPFRGDLVAEITDVLQRYPNLIFPDQDALNIVLSQKRKFIDPRWNQMTSVYWYKPDEELPYDPELWAKLKVEPWIVHYSGRPKPWEDGCDHPLAQHWRAAHEQTPWIARRRTALTRIVDRIPRIRRVLVKKLRRFLGR